MDATESPATLEGPRLEPEAEGEYGGSSKPRSRSSPREDLRLWEDFVESALRRLLFELELTVLRASEDDRPPPMRALNMVGKNSQGCPDGTDHHVGG